MSHRGLISREMYLLKRVELFKGRQSEFSMVEDAASTVRSMWWSTEAWSQRQAGPEDMHRPLTGHIDVDVAIIGGGFTGLWTAIHLLQSEPGLRVAIVEKEICGAGPSGRNGGIMNGYSSSFAKLTSVFGRADALEIVSLGATAQGAVIDFIKGSGRDAWLQTKGFIVSAAAPWQQEGIDRILEESKDLPANLQPRHVNEKELSGLFGTNALSAGAWFPEGATLQPFRLVAALKAYAVSLGVQIYEASKVQGVNLKEEPVLYTNLGSVSCKKVVMAGNAWMSGARGLKRHLTNLGSYMIVTAPIPDLASKMSEQGRGLAFSDARMFVNWAHTTPDSRLIVGHGAGPLSYNGVVSAVHRHDEASIRRAVDFMHRCYPFTREVSVDAGWGGPIDMSADRLPFFGTHISGKAHYAVGYSGHGITPTWIGGRVLSSLVLGREDAWTESVFCRRSVPGLPPEPFRYIGGRPIQRSTLSIEDSADAGRRPSLIARGVAGVPSALGMKIGTR